MKSEEIIKILEEKYPPSCAEEWDNPGLLLGTPGQGSPKNPGEPGCDGSGGGAGPSAGGRDMIVSHHPLIFRGIKKISDETFLGRRLLTLAEHRIVCYAMPH